MKDRSIRRHQEIKARIKNTKKYNSCLADLSPSERAMFGSNVDKLRKACVSSHSGEAAQKKTRKTLQEIKHDITMREQMRNA